MSKFIAKVAIGGFNPGDEVPADKATVWMQMYAESPVKEVEDSIPAQKPALVKENVVQEMVQDVKKVEKSFFGKKKR